MISASGSASLGGQLPVPSPVGLSWALSGWLLGLRLLASLGFQFLSQAQESEKLGSTAQDRVHRELPGGKAEEEKEDRVGKAEERWGHWENQAAF